MTEHRPRLRLGSVHRYPDPAHSRDPRVRRLVGALRGLPVTPEPDARFRADLRAQLVAVAPRLVEEGDPSAPRPAPRRAGAAGILARLPRVRVGRGVGIALGALCVFVLLLGGAVWISTKALPGDALYTVKRASENARLALAGSDTERAKDYLSFATTRAEEVSDLIGRPSASALAGGTHAAGGISDHTAALVDSTLDSADDDVREASRLLGNLAVRDASATPLAILTDWAPGQQQRLDAIVARVPDGVVHQRLLDSLHTLRTAVHRAAALQQGIGCSCLSTARADEFGPLPCNGCAAGPQQQAPAPAPHSAPASSPASTPAPPGPSAGTHPPGRATPGGATSDSSPRSTHSTTSTTPGGAATSQQHRNGATTPHTHTGGNTSSTSGKPTSPAPGTSSPPAQPSSPQPTQTCVIVLLGICI